MSTGHNEQQLTAALKHIARNEMIKAYVLQTIIPVPLPHTIKCFSTMLIASFRNEAWTPDTLSLKCWTA
jgi:ABC-type antimicrobial peptide transport system permease subunit